MKPLEYYLEGLYGEFPVRIPETHARSLAKTTQRGTVPRLGRFLLVTLSDGSVGRLERIAKHRYLLHPHPGN